MNGHLHQQALAHLVNGWADYAAAHEQHYHHSPIGESDLAYHWARVGRGILGLLNHGEHGFLDAVRLSAFIKAAMRAEGIEP